MQKIAVVGGGLIGHGWAVVFAQSGYEVAIYDPSADVRKTVRNTIFSIGLTEAVRALIPVSVSDVKDSLIRPEVKT